MSDALSISSATAAPALDASVVNGGLAQLNAATLRMDRVHSEAEIDKTAKDFESVFATEMLQPMFKGLDVDPMFGGGHGEEAMRVFLLREYGKTIAASGKLGIASKVKAEMLKAQEMAQAEPANAAPVGMNGAALPPAYRNRAGEAGKKGTFHGYN